MAPTELRLTATDGTLTGNQSDGTVYYNFNLGSVPTGSTVLVIDHAVGVSSTVYLVGLDPNDLGASSVLFG